ncbi:MAG: response regulator transcription factor [Bdellovibrionota bacterium]
MTVSSMKAKSILVVEDEQDVADLLALHLKREGYSPLVCDNGEEALKLVSERNDFHLLILDWMLPGVSGLDLCRHVRKRPGKDGQVPILMVTARADAADIVLGLEVGADDYMTKPFEIPILLARVRALLRRGEIQAGSATSPPGDQRIRMDVDSFRVFCEGAEVILTRYEFNLLHALLSNRGKVLTRKMLVSLVQGTDVSVIDRTIDTHVFGLRKKLGRCAEIIETIRGVGYRVQEE